MVSCNFRYERKPDYSVSQEEEELKSIAMDILRSSMKAIA
ncbi:hypothetical protein Ga0080574_TMP884 [Salipiger abyssi]|uniref:Uncharacterized protein n=1 Tax=Salipiger abyssi TaxID=1250539 RepID=A0A1P8UPE2_9RHOB|nr:hypothetical protein Ga0080574_TMP884 [Salipiger abyssi]